jgi:hypothetical protein
MTGILQGRRSASRALMAMALLAASAAAAVAAGSPVEPQRNWLGLRTANFRLVGNAGEKDLRRVAQRLEQFREALGVLFPKAVLMSQSARDLLTQLDAAERHGAEPAVAHAASPGSLSGTPASRTYTPIFRKTNAGEARMAGWLTGIDCDSNGITLHIKGPGGAVTLHATRFDDVEFISYREDRQGTISCGAGCGEETVIATFRPRPNGSDHAGDAVAVEFPPPEYVPK